MTICRLQKDAVKRWILGCIGGDQRCGRVDDDTERHGGRLLAS